MNTIRLPEQNQVLLVGRLTRDPEVRYTQKGQAVARFDIAVNRRWKDPTGEWKEDTTFVTVVAWGPMAERCKDKLKKGLPVHVEGRLSMDEYTDKTGQKRRTLQVVARRIQFLAQATGGGAGADNQEGAAPVAAQEEADDVPF
ncbi:MAG TPA: single-stranded DNA-binding protein [Elusimicrobiales bacterium]|nr:single-stranded DNA-binding protein [Elusimicrobiales bacterium]